MARNTHGTRSELIHCDTCDEDYSATYKKCPFCGARPDKGAYTQATRFFAPVRGEREAPPPTRSRAEAPRDDGEYVFDGQDVFDDEGEDDYDDYGTHRGGKRLADDGFGITPTTIAGILFSAVIIVAAILIVVLVVVPMVQSGSTPPASNSPPATLPGNTASISPAPSTGDPDASGTPGTGDPTVTGDPDPSNSPADPGPGSTTSVPPATTGGFTLTWNGEPRSEFTISDKYPQPIQLRAEGATGTVTWTSGNTAVATVSANGLVTAVAKGNTTITATDSAGHTKTCKVGVTISGGAAPSPSASGSEAPSTPPAATGTLTLSRSDFTLNDKWPTYTFTVTGADGAVTWFSDNTSVATVDANGKVTRVGNGKCNVTATDSSGKTATCIVRCN